MPWLAVQPEVAVYPILLLPLSASAATLTVGASGRDYTTIQAAIDAAADGDSIEVDAGTYAENLTVDVSVAILGNTGTIVTAPGPVIVVGAVDASIAAVEVQAQGGRGIEVRQGELDLEGVKVSGAVNATEAGGGLYALESTVSLIGCTFTNNGASINHGGHLYGYASTLLVSGSTFNAGRAEKGGAIYSFGGSVEVVSSNFTANEARADDESSRGGAIRGQDAVITVEDCTFDGNQATIAGYGGAIATSGGELTVTTSSFVDNEAIGFYGGAIAAYDTAVTITEGVFNGNTAVLAADGTGYGHAGAVLIYGTGATSASITDATFEGNVAEGYGGGLRVEAGDVLVQNTTFEGNAADFGGAMHLATPAAVSIEGGLFSANEAAHAGAIRWRPDADAASLTISGTRFVDNVISGYGAAIYARSGGELTLLDNEVTGNQSVVGGALMLWDIDRIDAKRNTFCKNLALGDSAASDGGAATVYLSGGGGLNSWKNNLFVENDAAAYGGGLNVLQSVSTLVVNNSFLANKALASGGAVALRESNAGFVNNLIAWTGGGNGLTSDETSTVTPTYNAFWQDVDNTVGGNLDPTLLDPTNLKVDPLLVAWTEDGDCANDVAWLQASSPLVDAGDPSILDPDGTRSDIGAFGGPDAEPGLYADTDEDGWVDLRDCAPDDATVHPEADEIPYDGLDQDCDGADLEDVDGDFWEAIQVGGEDCDDTNVDVNPGEEEIWYDGVDQDCDGNDDDQDGDGYAAEEAGGDDCADLDPSVNPLAVDEIGDGIDQNCDGVDGSEDDGDDGRNQGGCNCDGTGGAGTWLAGLLAAALLRRRR